MKTKNGIIHIFVAVGLSMLIASCGANKRISQTQADESQEIKNTPCECKDTREIVRARGMRESMDQQMAKQMARSNALDELASKIRTAVRSTINDYALNRNVNMKEEQKRRYEGQIMQDIDLTISGYRAICEKYTISKRPDGSKVYKCFYAIEIDKDDVARAVYQSLTKEDKNDLDYDYDRFNESFEKGLRRAANN